MRPRSTPGFPGFSDVVGGLYYASNGDDTSDCVVTTVAGFFDDCLILADDFRQYCLGAFDRASTGGLDVVDGLADPIEGFEGNIGGPVGRGQPRSTRPACSRRPARCCPPAQFPQFASQGAADYRFTPVEGNRYAGARHVDDSYMRLTRTTLDLSAADERSAAVPAAAQQRGACYDHLIVEARTPGQDDWTTLPEAGGASSTTPPSDCTDHRVPAGPAPVPASLLPRPGLRAGRHERRVELHHRQHRWLDGRGVRPDRVPRPGGRAVDLVRDRPDHGWCRGVRGRHARRGRRRGVRRTASRAPRACGRPAARPAGSPANPGRWQITEQLDFFGGTSTEDTLLLGFGLEQLATPGQRADIVERALDGLID